MSWLCNYNVKTLRVKYQGYRHNIYVLRNAFSQENSKDDFQLLDSGVYGYWFYILIEEILTMIIEGLQTLEDLLHKN